MFKSTGEIEQYLWDQVSNNTEIIGAVWIENREVRAQAIRNDFDLNVLEQFYHRSISPEIFRPYSIHLEFTHLVVFRTENKALMVIESTKDFRHYSNRRPADDQSPYIFISPDMGLGFA